MTDLATAPFSVLLPVYAGDRPEYLERSFRSVTAEQELAPDEVVIVRDGPVSPQLERMLEVYEREAPVPVSVVRLDRNVGLAHALEAGLVRCRHEIVARQDADDISRPERFAVQLPMIVAGLDVVGSAIEEFEVEGPDGLIRMPPLSQEEIEARSRFTSPFNHPTVVYRKSVVAEAGGYEDLPLMEDYWLFARLVEHGARLGNSPEPLVLYRVGAGAYARRGGWSILRSELILQRRMRRLGFTSVTQMVRNLVVRGGYRLVPEGVRRRAYRQVVVRDGSGSSSRS